MVKPADFKVDTEALGSAADVVKQACLDLHVGIANRASLGLAAAGSPKVSHATEDMSNRWQFGRQRTLDTLEAILLVLRSAQDTYSQTENSITRGSGGGW